MANTAGKILLRPRGDYDATATYKILDFVRYQGNSYVAKTTTTGNLPTDTTYWQAMTDGDNYCVTPEMYGAVGDGVTNDAAAFELALNDVGSLYLSNKEYLLGDEVIDCSSKDCIEIIGKNRKSRLRGGTFIVNVNETWTGDKNDSVSSINNLVNHFEGVAFLNNNHNAPSIVTGTPIILENCEIYISDKFLVFPSDMYVDRVNFLECNIHFESNAINLIMASTAVDTYTDWNGAGDNWYFANCSFPSQKATPLFRVSHRNYGVTFQNCINPRICYGGDTTTYGDFGQITFNGCHCEINGAICAPQANSIISEMAVDYLNCYFHSYANFNPHDEFGGVNYYTAKQITYSEYTDMGMTPKELDNYNGVLLAYSAQCKHRKGLKTKYSIPSDRSVAVSSQVPDRYRVTPITDTYDYVFFFSDNANEYDATTKVALTNVAPNTNDFIYWAIKGGIDSNFYLHVYRKNKNTSVVEKCVIYIGYAWTNITQRFCLMQDGGNSIDGLYKWVEYDGELPS